MTPKEDSVSKRNQMRENGKREIENMLASIISPAKGQQK